MAAETDSDQDQAAAPATFVVTSSPHVRSPESIPRIMWTVNATLVPAAAWGVYVFGLRALCVMLVGIGSAVATEALVQLLRRRPVTIHDGSAFLTGLLVALILPVHAPWYVTLAASVFAIAIAKQAFGGLGCNIWNPALAGRAFVLASYVALLTVGSGWPEPFGYRRKARQKDGARRVDAVTAATPLTKAKKALKMFNGGERGKLPAPTSLPEAKRVFRDLREANTTPLADLFFGRVGGCIGEVSAFLLALGGIPLIVFGYVKWRVPVFYIGTVALLSWMLPVPVRGEHAKFYVALAGDPLFHMFAGGLFLGAFYMATDMVTTPMTRKGLVIFGIGCGVLTVAIRLYGGYPEGVCYAILLMNTATPLIDRYTRPKVFGRGKAA